MNALVIVQAAAAVSLADAGGSTSDDLYGVATTKKSLALPTGSPDPVSRPSQ